MFKNQYPLCLLVVLGLTACQQNSPNPTAEQVAPASTALAESTPINNTTPSEPTDTQKKRGSDNKIHLDPSLLNTGVTPIDKADYPYPFAEDSLAVKNYANAYHISPKDAQHSMVLSMASPEALNKILDQIQGHYLGHGMTDGKDATLIIYTTDEVAEYRFDYVIADKFGEGLTLPVHILPKSIAKTAPQVTADDIAKRHASEHSPQ